MLDQTLFKISLGDVFPISSPFFGGEGGLKFLWGTILIIVLTLRGKANLTDRQSETKFQALLVKKYNKEASLRWI